MSRALEEYRRVIAEEADVLRAAQLTRIEEATLAIWPRVLNGEDRAVQSLCRLLERQAKLTGLDIEAQDEPERRMVIDLRLPDQQEEVIDGRPLTSPSLPSKGPPGGGDMRDDELLLRLSARRP